jgi:hypothetical protein
LFDMADFFSASPVGLARVVPVDNILFGSEMVGVVRGVDPRRARTSATGEHLGPLVEAGAPIRCRR